MQGSRNYVEMEKKKYQKNQIDVGEEEFSPLGLALLEQFAAGISIPCLSNNYLFFFVNVYQARSFHEKNDFFCHISEPPSIQALALAATKSGASRPDVQELAKRASIAKGKQSTCQSLMWWTS